MLSREGRRPLPTRTIAGQDMFALDDLVRLFELSTREDTAAGAAREREAGLFDCGRAGFGAGTGEAAGDSWRSSASMLSDGIATTSTPSLLGLVDRITALSPKV